VNTIFLLMAQYDGKAIVPVEDVCRDYFSHLDRVKFLRKTRSGALKIPVVAIEDSQKSAHGVHIQDLATYLDDRRKAALKGHERLHA